jgi:hypothetical protein
MKNVMIIIFSSTMEKYPARHAAAAYAEKRVGLPGPPVI